MSAFFQVLSRVSALTARRSALGIPAPFEFGPRNCIGQELAKVEMKIIMVMTLRRFRFTLAYSEIDGNASVKGVKSVYGERGYQILRAQPSEDLPCLVERLVR